MTSAAPRPHRPFPRTRPPESAPWHGNAEALARDLRRAVGARVGFDRMQRAAYATDASNYRQVPIGVVWPRSAGEVEAALEVCRRHGAPVLSRGGGTSLAGQCCNVAVVLDFSRHMHRVLEIDPEARLARVEPGCILDDLRRAAAAHGLTFGPDPATHASCTLGGMIGNNSCGVHSVMAGRTSDNVHELEVLTYDGARFPVGATGDAAYRKIVAGGGRRAQIHRALRELAERCGPEVRRRYPDIPRRVSGYNLDDLLPENGFHVARSLVGSEGTCALVLEATLHLVPRRGERALLVVSYEDAFRAADHVPEILQAGPIGLEGMDGRLVGSQAQTGLNAEHRALLPPGDGWLLVEFGSDAPGEAAAAARKLADRLAGARQVLAAQVYAGSREQALIWEIRESGLGGVARVPGQGDTYAGWEDSAVPPERLGTYMRQLRDLLAEHGLTAAFYGHFGDGCLHSRIDFDLTTTAGLEVYRRFVDRATDLVLHHGGVCSGEHGDGQARAELLPRLYGAEIAGAFRQYKTAWDPTNHLNPGKVVDPDPILSHLRLGADGIPPEPETVFTYPDDDHRFSRAVLRCVGVGRCRRESDTGTMCPSYRVTRREEHSTRGRARLLHEMLEGDVITDGWRSREVREALDLCLACKGCKSDCPTGVDVATYKAEFLHHHDAGRLRPRAAYAMGWIHRWARLATRAPRLVNALTAAPGTGHLAKALAGVSQRRTLPRFARRTFRDLFQAHAQRTAAGRRVILWPDTFTNVFHPRIGQAAVEVLRAAGFRVELPAQLLCCGRPLYDYGFLTTARRLLTRTLDALEPEIEAGVPVVGLEPSCVAVFRDELPHLLHGDPRARRLSRQTFTLAELLEGEHHHLDLPQLPHPALYHGHCHHKAVMGTGPDLALLRRLGLDLATPDTGCCGMAGAFGFEGDKYDLSVACGERVLLPAVRAAATDALLIADGFSCREQIRQETGRRAVHTAEVLQRALAHPG